MKRILPLIGLIAAMFISNLTFAQVMTPETPPKGVKIASSDDIQRLIKEGGIIYDVRWHYSEYVFEGHIPTAITVPFTEYSKKSVDYNISEDTWDWTSLPKDKNKAIAFYCMGDACWKSYKVADEAAKRGYTNVYWYREGQPGWDKKGLPVESRNEAYVPMQKMFKSAHNPNSWMLEPEVLEQWYAQKANLKVIDLRYESFTEEGRLETSFQVPLKELLSRDGIQLLPQPSEKVKIVLVSANGQHAAAAAVALNLLGYEAYVLNGGMEAWYQKMGQKHIVKGKLDVNQANGKSWKGQLFKLPKGA